MSWEQTCCRTRKHVELTAAGPAEAIVGQHSCMPAWLTATIDGFCIQTFCIVTLQFFPLKGRVYFPTPWVSVTYFGQLNVAEVIVYYSRPQEVLHTSTLLLGPLPCYGNMTGVVWWRLKDHVNGSVIIPKYVREPSQDQQSFLTYP